jgi:DNA-3-methyladenine glycosylase II
MTHNSFELKPVSPFRLDLTVWTLRRRPSNVVDRWDGVTYRRVLSFPTGTVEVAVTQSAPAEAARLQIVVAAQPASAAIRSAVTSVLERLLGLRVDLSEFYQFAAHNRRLGPLAQRFRGMRPPRFATLFEAVINAIACQQMTLTLGIRLLSDLAVAFGAAFNDRGETFHAFPRPVDLAGLSPADLQQFGFSRQKGLAMIELAQTIVEGQLNLEELADFPDDEAVKRLCEIRGVGRWTAEYVLLRGLGRTHVFPGDDVGARNNLQRWLRLVKPLDYEEVGRVLSCWDGYAGLVYFHLLLDRLEEAGHLGKIDFRERDFSGSRKQANAGPAPDREEAQS